MIPEAQEPRHDVAGAKMISACKNCDEPVACGTAAVIDDSYRAPARSPVYCLTLTSASERKFVPTSCTLMKRAQALKTMLVCTPAWPGVLMVDHDDPFDETETLKFVNRSAQQSLRL
jgi:hypothetical protein